jgi:uncharacterized protein YabN with tetrapyrrole methylase and pyrophosphatase domain
MKVHDPADEARLWLERLESAAETENAGEVERAVGMLCMNVVALAGRAHVNPEDALRRALGRLTAAFREEEEKLDERGEDFSDLSPEELNQISQRLLEACKGDRE